VTLASTTGTPYTRRSSSSATMASWPSSAPWVLLGPTAGTPCRATDPAWRTTWTATGNQACSCAWTSSSTSPSRVTGWPWAQTAAWPTRKRGDSRSRWPSPVHPGPGQGTWTPSSCCEHWQRRSGCSAPAATASRRPRAYATSPGPHSARPAARGIAQPSPGAGGDPGVGYSVRVAG
jgi:hypothetical protein